jgi:hypothetical protein
MDALLVILGQGMGRNEGEERIESNGGQIQYSSLCPNTSQATTDVLNM